MVSEFTTTELRQRAIDRFWETIPQIWNLVRNNVRSIAAERFELSVEHFHILRHIRKGHSSVSDLAEARSISRPAVSQAVEALVEKGLVSRQQDAVDRRFVKLMLTPEGDELLNKIFQQNRIWMVERMNGFSDDDLKQMIDAFDTLKTMFADCC
jgi:DNA-binding MarR family transcriptional regulator